MLHKIGFMGLGVGSCFIGVFFFTNTVYFLSHFIRVLVLSVHIFVL